MNGPDRVGVTDGSSVSVGGPTVGVGDGVSVGVSGVAVALAVTVGVSVNRKASCGGSEPVNQNMMAAAPPTSSIADTARISFGVRVALCCRFRYASITSLAESLSLIVHFLFIGVCL